MLKFLSQIKSEILEIKSTKKELREFGIVMGCFFLLIAVIKFWKHKNFIPPVSISGAFFILSFLAPFILRPLQKIWMGFAVIMGYFMTRIILGVLFYLVLTPLSLISRLTGKKFLSTEFDKKSETYWIQKPVKEPLKEHYEKQF